MKFAVDLDGVLADPMQPWCELYADLYGKRVSVGMLTQYDVASLLGISTSEFFRLYDKVWHDWRRVPPTEDLMAAKVASLRYVGQVDIVTGRTVMTSEAAQKWLRHHRIPYDNFVRTPGILAKVKLDYDVFIDDAPDLMMMLSSSGNRHGVLYERPWNKDVEISPRVHRVRSWSQIPRLLESLDLSQTRRIDDWR